VHKETIIRPIGNSLGTTIPRTMLERYRLGAGDRAYLVETERGVLLTPYDPDFEAAMEIYEEGARAYRNAMRELSGR
jgi:antitoxin MazE